jgi:heme-degrading monooxygenase HmoA
MAVLISSKVAGQTKEGYDGVLMAVRESIKKAPGFIMQCAHPAEDGWNVTEVWASKKDADQWFAKYVVPNIPPGVHPKRSYQDLYNVITPFE